MSRLLDRRVIAQIGPDFFPDRCDILQDVKDEGKTKSVWEPLLGHQNLRCRLGTVGRFGSTGTRRRETEDFTRSEKGIVIIIKSYRPSISTRHRVTVKGTNYEIELVAADSQLLMTSLEVKQTSI